MKHELDRQLRAGARRELCEPPAGIPERVRARLGDAPVRVARPARDFPFGLVASLAAAGLLATAFWPGAKELPVPPRQPASLPNPSALAVADLTQKGIQYAARIDRPLADEWHLMVQNSLQLYDALVGQLPTLPR